MLSMSDGFMGHLTYKEKARAYNYGQCELEKVPYFSAHLPNGNINTTLMFAVKTRQMTVKSSANHLVHEYLCISVTHTNSSYIKGFLLSPA